MNRGTEVLVRMHGGPHHGVAVSLHFSPDDFGERLAFSTPVLRDQRDAFDPAYMWDYRSAVPWTDQSQLDVFCAGPGVTVHEFLQATE